MRAAVEEVDKTSERVVEVTRVLESCEADLGVAAEEMRKREGLYW